MDHDQTYLLNHLSAVFHTGLYALQGDEMTVFEENPEYNPIYVNPALRKSLADGAKRQNAPFIYRDEFLMYYVCVKCNDLYYMMGPLCTQVMNMMQRHRFYRFYGVETKWEKGLHYHTLMEILQIVGMLAKIMTGQEYTDQDLMDANYHAVSDRQEQQDQIRFDILSENEDIYRHTYQEERRILDAVRNGQPDEAVRLSKEMDANVGRLGESELEHWRNLSIVSATLCARAAIEGGVMPSKAYRLSGFYINKCTSCKDITQVLIYRNHAVEELTKCVREQKEKKHIANYTQQCMNYIYAHYREKIYLSKVADSLGITGSYLSRLFKQETGKTVQDFVCDVRVEKAANLLRFSTESLSDIAEYVNFPSQSYFGKIFRQKMGMTPKQYRDQYKPAEFH